MEAANGGESLGKSETFSVKDCLALESAGKHFEAFNLQPSSVVKVTTELLQEDPPWNWTWSEI